MNLVQATGVLSELRDDVEVVSAGAEDTTGELERLCDAVLGLGLGNRMRFLGQRLDAPDLMSAADVIVNPSDVEGLPIALLEAMHLGRPIVATDVGGVSSLIEDGVTGLLVPPREPDLLAKAVETILSNPMLARRLGEAGKCRVKRQFSVEAAVRQIEHIYSSVLPGRQGDVG
jgi:glycosyltransferase involved in cell wall biosynthesis